MYLIYTLYTLILHVLIKCMLCALFYLSHYLQVVFNAARNLIFWIVKYLTTVYLHLKFNVNAFRMLRLLLENVYAISNLNS